MAANLATVASAISQVSTPVVKSGNPTSSSGQALPPPRSAPPQPQIDFTRVVRQIETFVENGQRSLQFTEDAATGRMIMTVVNPETKEVIRQVPADELLALAQTLDGLQGQIINAEA